MTEEASGRKRLWLVRHGLTQANSERRYCGQSDPPLSTEGERQARQVASYLRNEPLVALYGSDLLRTRQTAEAIAQEQPRKLHLSPEWRELSFGEWEGLTYEEIVVRGATSFFSDPLHAAPPGGETLTMLGERVQRAFDDLLLRVGGEEKGTAYVLVSHGGPLRIALCLLLGLPIERHWQFQLDPGSLSAVDLFFEGKRTPQVTFVLLNYVPAKSPL